MKSALLLAVIYTGASVGSVVGGWLSGHLMERGWRVGQARLGTMLIPAMVMPMTVIAYYTDSFVLCVALVTMATAAHQWWSATLFTTATDLFPTKVAGAVTGLGSMAGGIGGMFMTLLVALVVQWTGNQQMVFVWAGTMHPTSLLIYWLWIGTAFPRASVDHIPDLSRWHAPLLTAGTATVAVAALLSTLIYSYWNVCVKATSLAGAAQAATAAGGVLVIGCALAYAGMARRRSAA
jgi:ACS family hexuronate transporter-like MFS transporter